MEARRWHRPSLAELPTDLAIKIAGCLAATSERPMDNLRVLWATCHSMLRLCGEPEVGRRVALRRFADDMSWDDPVGYATLVSCLTKVGNPEACFLTGMEVVFRKGTPLAPVCTVELQRVAEFGHNLAAYVAAILLYRANDGAVSNNAARRYMRQVEGHGDGGPQFRNDGCLRWREEATERIWRTYWRRILDPPEPAAMPMTRGDLLCAGGMCGSPVNPWEPQGLTKYCSEDCRIQGADPSHPTTADEYATSRITCSHEVPGAIHADDKEESEWLPGSDYCIRDAGEQDNMVPVSGNIMMRVSYRTTTTFLCFV
ncbi:hypothetical protein C2845_PM17G07440 [Panicum miliaceum]|uniref:Uncharacterized protein n=1 Tax=Panicum miliaceum TaxID=4540 RepID=A0A3L6Q2P6_PANMI|nr:hypothetical protein C2845_PM17G07440 [Panicum miliaceum]